MSRGGSDSGPDGPPPVSARMRRFWAFAVIAGIAILAWNVWVIRDLVTATEPHSGLPWISVILQTTIGITLVLQGLLVLRAPR